MRFVCKCPIFDAVAIAATSEISRLEILKNILENIFREEVGFDSLDFIEEVGRGKLSVKRRRELEPGGGVAGAVIG
jgi:hypothetical protein